MCDSSGALEPALQHVTDFSDEVVWETHFKICHFKRLLLSGTSGYTKSSKCLKHLFKDSSLSHWFYVTSLLYTNFLICIWIYSWTLRFILCTILFTCHTVIVTEALSCALISDTFTAVLRSYLGIFSCFIFLMWALDSVCSFHPHSFSFSLSPLSFLTFTRNVLFYLPHPHISPHSDSGEGERKHWRSHCPTSQDKLDLLIVKKKASPREKLWIF